MRNMRFAITGLVVVFGLFTTATISRADDHAATQAGAVAPDDTAEDPGVTYFDYRRLTLHTDKTIEFGHCFSEFNLGGGALTTLSKGDEFNSTSFFGFGQARSRFLSLNLARPLTIQLGLGVEAEGSVFKSSEYEGDKIRTGIKLEMAFLHNSRDPLWQINARMGPSLDNETGESRTSNYVLNYQRSILWEMEGSFSWLGFFIKTGEYRAWRNQRVRTGFFPNIEVSAKITLQLDAKRRESFNGPDNDNTAVEFRFTPYLYRGAWEQGIWQFAPIIGVRIHQANGYLSEKRGTDIVTFQFGATGTIQLFKHCFFGANVLFSDETNTGRLQFSAGGYFSFNIW